MGFKFFDIEEEFKKNKELKKENLELLKEWLEKQPHLPKMPDQQIILFLHSCYYNNEITKTVIDNFFTIRSHVPEFFSNRTKEALMEELDVVAMPPLPILTHNNHLVVYAKLLITDPDRWTFSGFIKKLDMASMLWLNNKGTNVGHEIIIDMFGSCFGHVTKIGIMQMKKFLTYLQDAMPVRLKGLHFVNAPHFMDKLLALMKPFMKKELMDMLHVHTDNFETLYPFVPKKCLPKELGGDCPPLLEMHEDIIKYVFDNMEFFELESKQVVDEIKRPGKPKDAGELFGIEGTFKKLDID